MDYISSSLIICWSTIWMDRNKEKQLYRLSVFWLVYFRTWFTGVKQINRTHLSCTQSCDVIIIFGLLIGTHNCCEWNRYRSEYEYKIWSMIWKNDGILLLYQFIGLKMWCFKELKKSLESFSNYLQSQRCPNHECLRRCYTKTVKYKA